MELQHYRAFALIAALGTLTMACAGTGDEALEESLAADDVAASQQELSKAPLAATTSLSSASLSKPPVIKDPGTVVVYFQCGWDPKSLSAQCTCSGDADCNRMFTSGFCGANASCDSGAGTCTCDLKL